MTQALTTLNLYNNQIGPQGAQQLANALQRNQVKPLLFQVTLVFLQYFIQTLTTLSLEENQIGSQGAQHLANALQRNQVTLITLDHSRTFLTDTCNTQSLE